MKIVFSIAPWLMDLFNPPPRASLTFGQKVWRVMLVTITLVTLCIIASLGLSLGFFAFQRSREFFEGEPQILNGLAILAASIVINVVCVATLLHIKKFDRRLIPPTAARH